jgi:hypothetical protein
MFTKLRNAYHNAHTWAHHHTVVVAIWITLLVFMAAWQLFMPQLQTHAANDQSSTCIDGMSWQPVGPSGFSYTFNTSMVRDNEDNIYIAFVNVNNDYKTTVMKFNGTNWEQLGSPWFTDGNTYNDTSLTVNSNNQVYLAYADPTNDSKISVSIFDGNDWMHVGSSWFSDNQAARPSLITDNNNQLYISYSKNRSQIHVMTFDGIDWINLNEDYSIGWSESSLAIDSNNNLYIAYTNNGVNVIKFDGIDWNPIGNAQLSSISTWELSMTIDSNDQIYIAYPDNSDEWKITVMTFDLNNWTIVGNPWFSEPWAYSMQTTIDEYNNIYVIYSNSNNNYKTSVMTFNGSEWVYVWPEWFGTDAGYQSIISTSTSQLYAAYSSRSNGLQVMTYAECTEQSPDRSDPMCTIEDFGVGMYFTSDKEWDIELILAFDSYDDNNNPVFIFEDWIKSDILILYFDWYQWIIWEMNYGDEEIHQLAISSTLLWEYVWIDENNWPDIIGIRSCDNLNNETDPTCYGPGYETVFAPYISINNISYIDNESNGYMIIEASYSWYQIYDNITWSHTASSGTITNINTESTTFTIEIWWDTQIILEIEKNWEIYKQNILIGSIRAQLSVECEVFECIWFVHTYSYLNSDGTWVLEYSRKTPRTWNWTIWNQSFYDTSSTSLDPWFTGKIIFSIDTWEGILEHHTFLDNYYDQMCEEDGDGSHNDTLSCDFTQHGVFLLADNTDGMGLGIHMIYDTDSDINNPVFNGVWSDPDEDRELNVRLEKIGNLWTINFRDGEYFNDIDVVQADILIGDYNFVPWFDTSNFPFNNFRIECIIKSCDFILQMDIAHPEITEPIILTYREYEDFWYYGFNTNNVEIYLAYDNHYSYPQWGIGRRWTYQWVQIQNDIWTSDNKIWSYNLTTASLEYNITAIDVSCAYEDILEHEDTSDENENLVCDVWEYTLYSPQIVVDMEWAVYGSDLAVFWLSITGIDQYDSIDRDVFMPERDSTTWHIVGSGDTATLYLDLNWRSPDSGQRNFEALVYISVQKDNNTYHSTISINPWWHTFQVVKTCEDNQCASYIDLYIYPQFANSYNGLEWSNILTWFGGDWYIDGVLTTGSQTAYLPSNYSGSIFFILDLFNTNLDDFEWRQDSFIQAEYVSCIDQTSPSEENKWSWPTGSSNNPPQLITDQQAGLCEIRDCSDSYYDQECGICDEEQNHGSAEDKDKDFLIDNPIEFMQQVGNVMRSMTCQVSQELVQAYVFSYDLGITTVADICDADMYGPVIRKHLAKFLSMFAVQVLGMTPDTTRVCEFTDMGNEWFEMQWFARMACQLGIMGLQQDGTPDTVFNPNQVVNRAMFGTALSRILGWEQYNSTTGLWYQAHLNALQANNIMTQINNPMMEEVRGYVMLMLMRAYQFLQE